ncbi:MAG: BCCT family transporter [Oscillospiraceae bacterium]|nr:BCCT family transporter [Oscillospiraceae bacterium]
MKKAKQHIVTPVFAAALCVMAAILAAALITPAGFSTAANQVKGFLSRNFSWYYILLASGIVLVSTYLMLSPAGRITLGQPGEKPEYSTASWVAMLFSAGMGIGLVFYGAALPLTYYAKESPMAKPGTEEALSQAFQWTYYQQGIHAWAIYGIVALALAYFQFRKKDNALISSTLRPLLGQKVDGGIGRVIDVFTIIATVTGVATTLGFGAAQINSGLNSVFGVREKLSTQFIIIAVCTVAFLISATTGLQKGVKVLSNGNMFLAFALLILAFLVGPKAKILNTLVESTGNYIFKFTQMSFFTGASSAHANQWVQNWTFFYWAWWIAWAPFVGIFIARISRGRTIREFTFNVIFLPTIISILWYGVFGTLSTSAAQSHPSLIALRDEQVLFATFSHYPLARTLSVIAIVLIFSFFITSADSASFVLAMQSENGRLEPHNRIKVVWGVTLALIAAVLLYAGGLQALQDVMITLSFPFSVIMILMVISLAKDIHRERIRLGLYLIPPVDADRKVKAEKKE